MLWHAVIGDNEVIRCEFKDYFSSFRRDQDRNHHQWGSYRQIRLGSFTLGSAETYRGKPKQEYHSANGPHDSFRLERAYTATLTDPGSSKRRRDTGTYVHVYRKAPDNAWKVVTDIHTNSEAAAIAEQ